MKVVYDAPALAGLQMRTIPNPLGPPLAVHSYLWDGPYDRIIIPIPVTAAALTAAVQAYVPAGRRVRAILGALEEAKPFAHNYPDEEKLVALHGNDAIHKWMLQSLAERPFIVQVQLAVNTRADSPVPAGYYLPTPALGAMPAAQGAVGHWG